LLHRPDVNLSSGTRIPVHSFGRCAPNLRESKHERLPMQVLVRENNIDQALRVLKKKMQREGIFREMKQRRSYEKPSVRRSREKAEAIRRARKQARKKAQREGLIADPRKKTAPGTDRQNQRSGVRPPSRAFGFGR
jgi:small subunit ribosomal protein S21